MGSHSNTIVVRAPLYLFERTRFLRINYEIQGDDTANVLSSGSREACRKLEKEEEQDGFRK